MIARRIRIVSLVCAASWLACASPDQYKPKDDAGPDGSGEEIPDTAPPSDVLPADAPPPGVDVPPPPDGPTVDVPEGPPMEAGAPPPDGPCGTPTDPRHCGTCNNDCTKLPNVVASAVTCQAGTCVISASACAPGYAHCSTDPAAGCEASLSRPETCGACGTKCAAGDLCSSSGGSYKCVSGCMGTTPDKCGTTCTNLANDPRNCVTCGHDCTALPHVRSGAPVTCGGGKCVLGAGSCAPGWDDCNGDPNDGCEADLSRTQTCGACNTKCATGDLCATAGASYQCVSGCMGATPDKCGTTCTNLASDPRNCVTCGHDCTALPHLRAGAPVACGSGKCILGSGSCAAGWDDCNGDPSDGCEADLSRAQTCGACNVSCSSGKVCSASGSSFQCVCPAATPNACNSTCTNFQTDPANCGSCGHSCASLPNVKPGASVSCSSGQCSIPAASCASGYGNCQTSNPDDGCETMVSTNTNCGACGAGCSGGKTCMASGQSYACACPASAPNTCGNSCVNLQEDGNNCGSCGHSCLGGPCAAGKCQPFQVYGGGDATYRFTFDSTYIYFIREKAQNFLVISRISKADGSGFKDIWATNIGSVYSPMVLVGGTIYWAGQFDIMGCPAPDCAGGPQVKVANQANGEVFTDTAKSTVYWIADDATTPTTKNLMKMGRATPLASTTDSFNNPVADSSYIYVNEGYIPGGGSAMTRVPVGGGSKTPLGAGYAPALNSSKIIVDVETPVAGGGSSPAMWSMDLVTGNNRMLVGNYGATYDVWGGIVADDQNVYWSIYGQDKNGGPDGDFLFKCPLSGCGNNPTMIARGTFPGIGTMQSDGTALFTSAPSGIYKLAK